MKVGCMFLQRYLIKVTYLAIFDALCNVSPVMPVLNWEMGRGVDITKRRQNKLGQVRSNCLYIVGEGLIHYTWTELEVWRLSYMAACFYHNVTICYFAYIDFYIRYTGTLAVVFFCRRDAEVSTIWIDVAIAHICFNSQARFIFGSQFYYNFCKGINIVHRAIMGLLRFWRSTEWSWRIWLDNHLFISLCTQLPIQFSDKLT
jgi:hypothetical protein